MLILSKKQYAFGPIWQETFFLSVKMSCSSFPKSNMLSAPSGKKPSSSPPVIAAAEMGIQKGFVAKYNSVLQQCVTTCAVSSAVSVVSSVSAVSG